jgi:hypothetical protein
MARKRAVYFADSLPQASKFQRLLAGYGIDGRIESGGSSPDVEPCIAVAVDEGDYEFAYELALGFDEQRGPDADEAESDQREALPVHDGWPICPRCRQPRTAICPTCGNRGHGWPSADSATTADPESMLETQGDEFRDLHGELKLLICPTCDTPFAARFDRSCAHCRRRFKDGASPSSPGSRGQPLSNRQIMLLVLCGLLAYVLWVFLLSPHVDP